MDLGDSCGTFTVVPFFMNDDDEELMPLHT